jgi:DNA topoisomerase-1
MDGDAITLEQALGLLTLPRIVGVHPEAKEPIEAGIGRFGPYVKLGGIYASLDKDDDVLIVGLNRAMELLAQKLASVRTLGPHPADKEPVLVRKGRFGPYAQHGNKVATLPRDMMMDDIVLDQAVALLAEKGKLLKPKGGRKAAAKKAAPTAKANGAAAAPAKAPAAKKATAKKATAKKAGAKKPSARKAPEKAKTPVKVAG